MLRPSLASFRSVVAPLLFGSVTLVAACGGSRPAPEEPPLLPQDDDKVQAPSSNKVKEGTDLLTAGKFEQAEKVLAEAVKEAPEDPQAAYYHGLALDELGRAAEARSAYARALELAPQLTEASRNLSASLLESGDAEAALQVIESGLKNATDDPALLTNRAFCLEILRSPEAPAAHLKALEKDPKNGALRMSYVAVLATLGKTKDALEELGRIEVEDRMMAIDVANAYSEFKEPAKCVKTLDAAIARAKDADLLIRRARCKHDAKDDAAALVDFQAAVELAPESAPAHYFLGLALAKGKPAEAKAHLAKAAELGKGTEIGARAEKALSGKK